MRGKDISLTVLAGTESVRVIRVVGENGGEELWDVGLVGEVRGVYDGEVIGGIRCSVLGGGRYEIVFPALGAGRYLFVVDGVNYAGEKERLIEGYVGYEEPRLVDTGVYETEEPEIVMALDKGVRRAFISRSTLFEKYANEAGEALEKLGELDDKLEKAEILSEGINEKISELVIPDGETGTWVVGGQDTGKPWKGERGRDGTSIRRIEVGSVAELPSNGNGGEYYYIRGARMRVKTLAAGESVYVYVKESMGYPASCGLYLDGKAVDVGGFGPLEDWVYFINQDFGGWLVSAELVNEQYIKLTNVVDYSWGVSIQSNYSDDFCLLDGIVYDVYTWIESKGVGSWVKLNEATDFPALPDATYNSIGGVQILNTIDDIGVEAYKVPSKQAIRSYVAKQIKTCVQPSDLEGYVTKEGVNDALQEGILNDYASKEYVQEQVSAANRGFIESAFGNKIVELSETEYSLLDSYEEGTYYFTFAD